MKILNSTIPTIVRQATTRANRFYFTFYAENIWK